MNKLLFYFLASRIFINDLKIIYRPMGNKGYPGLDGGIGFKGDKGSPGSLGPEGIQVKH